LVDQAGIVTGDECAGHHRYAEQHQRAEEPWPQTPAIMGGDRAGPEPGAVAGPQHRGKKQNAQTEMSGKAVLAHIRGAATIRC
jgi:hypothetical protein